MFWVCFCVFLMLFGLFGPMKWLEGGGFLEVFAGFCLYFGGFWWVFDHILMVLAGF